MRKLVSLVSLLTVISCSQKSPQFLENDYYRVALKISDQEELPFVMKVTSQNTLEIYNAEEVIQVDEVIYKNDSVFIQTPVFEGYIAAKNHE